MIKHTKIIFLILFHLFFLEDVEARTTAGKAAMFGVVPGMGHVMNNKYLEGAGWFFSVGLLGNYSPMAAFNIWQYSIYDAYRDAGGSNTSQESIWENLAAPYIPRNSLDLVGTPTTLIYGVLPAASAGSYPTPDSILVATTVGLGEEALFRGTMFPAFSKFFRSKFLGALVSSAVFGAAHTQYDSSGKTTVGLLGLVWCWQLDRNRYDLRKNIFSHMWIDAFLLPHAWSNSPSPAPALRLNFQF